MFWREILLCHANRKLDAMIHTSFGMLENRIWYSTGMLDRSLLLCRSLAPSFSRFGLSQFRYKPTFFEETFQSQFYHSFCRVNFGLGTGLIQITNITEAIANRQTYGVHQSGRTYGVQIRDEEKIKAAILHFPVPSRAHTRTRTHSRWLA